MYHKVGKPSCARTHTAPNQHTHTHWTDIQVNTSRIHPANHNISKLTGYCVPVNDLVSVYFADNALLWLWHYTLVAAAAAAGGGGGRGHRRGGGYDNTLHGQSDWVPLPGSLLHHHGHYLPLQRPPHMSKKHRLHKKRESWPCNPCSAWTKLKESSMREDNVEQPLLTVL